MVGGHDQERVHLVAGHVRPTARAGHRQPEPIAAELVGEGAEAVGAEDSQPAPGEREVQPSRPARAGLLIAPPSLNQAEALESSNLVSGGDAWTNGTQPSAAGP